MQRMRTLAQAAAFGQIAAEYLRMREQHPAMRALTIYRYMHDDQGLSPAQFVCATEVGHSWVHTGAVYGGDDGSYTGDGRCYCSQCGADGDA